MFKNFFIFQVIEMAKCLIVDDSRFMRKIIKDAVSEKGHEVVTEADNGTDGIEAYKKYKPDFVTMDITMGGKDGMVAVKEIKEFDPEAKIIVISALSETTIKMNEKDVIASAFLTKPFDKDDLLNKVNEILS